MWIEGKGAKVEPACMSEATAAMQVEKARSCDGGAESSHALKVRPIRLANEFSKEG